MPVFFLGGSSSMSTPISSMVSGRFLPDALTGAFPFLAGSFPFFAGVWAGSSGRPSAPYLIPFSVSSSS